MGFSDELAARVQRYGPAVVGLDPHPELLPEELRALGPAAAARAFCLAAVAAVAGVVAAVKPQSAFFEALGPEGIRALSDVVRSSREAGLLVILDAKRGDIGSTAAAYARATLDPDGPIGADAVTLSPYLGPESLQPYLPHVDAGRGLFVLVRTSNPGAHLWQTGIAERVAAWIRDENAGRRGGCGLGPIGAVVGATLPAEAARWRAELPGAWILAPGYGAQGACAADVHPLFRPDGLGLLVVSGRGVLFGPGADWRQGIADRARVFAADVRYRTA